MSFGLGPFPRTTPSIPGPSIIEKIDMLFTDVEIEGKKQGYKIAASEYEKVLATVEVDYKNTKNVFSDKTKGFNDQLNFHITILSMLERKLKYLEEQFSKFAIDFSTSSGIPIETINIGISGAFCIPTLSNFGVLDIIYKYKKNNLIKAINKGYMEASELWESKIKGLKNDLNDEKNVGSEKILNLQELIVDALDEISAISIKIANISIWQKG